jgi:hypothetical protein
MGSRFDKNGSDLNPESMSNAGEQMLDFWANPESFMSLLANAQ